MNQALRRRRSPAWYESTREAFLAASQEHIAEQLAGRAADENLSIEPAQTDEWRQSVAVLQRNLEERILILRDILATPGGEAVRHVILEFDFRRRGLRMDCVLIADGVLFVIEFKRTKLDRAAADQVMAYAVNLLEFHYVTRQWCEEQGAIVVPILALTAELVVTPVQWPGLAGHSWAALGQKPMACDRESIKDALHLGLQNRRTETAVSRRDWLASSFMPSSSILDATLSLYGNHDVTTIQEHAAPQAAINASVQEIRAHIGDALAQRRYHLVFLSGAPGAGKTLVGLNIVMRGQFADCAVFVTGNAPLVEVLNSALSTSYRGQGQRATTWAVTGYRHTDAHLLADAASFKIVKAHQFLGPRGSTHRQLDARVLVFDEAQRTYEKGRVVLGEKLAQHEADLILAAQMQAFPAGGAVIVALIGHNQAINRGERGIVAWLDAAERKGWSYSIGDQTLALAEIDEKPRWASYQQRRPLRHGHLHQSMRFYRNSAVEEWVAALLEGDAASATKLAATLAEHDSIIWLSRDLAAARCWARRHAVGGQRAGIIASGQARRLAAEGLFVDFKPDIAKWMLAPSSDIRSSNALETVQNQYQIQGLELDYSIVCWDADLRRNGSAWAAYKLSGSDWQNDALLEVAKNGYRVLLTRARKGMVVFVPTGDTSGEDKTRKVEYYDGVWEFLRRCGAQEFEGSESANTMRG